MIDTGQGYTDIHMDHDKEKGTKALAYTLIACKCKKHMYMMVGSRGLNRPDHPKP